MRFAIAIPQFYADGEFDLKRSAPISRAPRSWLR
jgi:hypothetical protein